jgi:hypothetical protein
MATQAHERLRRGELVKSDGDPFVGGNVRHDPEVELLLNRLDNRLERGVQRPQREPAVVDREAYIGGRRGASGRWVP